MRYIALIFSFLLSLCLNVDAQDNLLPTANLNTIDGRNIEIQKYSQEGNPKLISLWATWCGPCRMELKALDKVYPEWKEKYNVEIVAASVDIPPMLNSAKAMFERNDWDFTFLHDVNQEFISALGIRGIPFSILVDGEGQVQSVQQGYFPGYEKKLEKKIAAIVQ